MVLPGQSRGLQEEGQRRGEAGRLPVELSGGQQHPATQTQLGSAHPGVLARTRQPCPHLMTTSVFLVFSQCACSRCKTPYASVLLLSAFRT